MVKTPNHLNFFNLRRSNVPPPWFEYIEIPMTYNFEDTFVKWITKNLKGRFYISKSLSLSEKDSSTAVETKLKIGFEEPKELSYFTLACPFLKYH